jgi:hypothetical protein
MYSVLAKSLVISLDWPISMPWKPVNTRSRGKNTIYLKFTTYGRGSSNDLENISAKSSSQYVRVGAVLLGVGAVLLGVSGV